LSEKVDTLVAVYRKLADTLIEKNGKARLSNGSFVPELKDPSEALTMLVSATTEAGFTPGEEVYFGINCAADDYFEPDNGYGDGKGKFRTAEQLVASYVDLKVSLGYPRQAGFSSMPFCSPRKSSLPFLFSRKAWQNQIRSVKCFMQNVCGCNRSNLIDAAIHRRARSK